MDEHGNPDDALTPELPGTRASGVEGALAPDQLGASQLAAPHTGDAQAGAAALVQMLEQNQREAAASRAQARELVRALGQLQEAQEYLGTALRTERRRSRWLVALLVLAPLLGAGAVWLVWLRVDHTRDRLGDGIAELRENRWEGRTADLEAFHETRAAKLREDLDRAWTELESVRNSRDLSDAQKSEREAVLLNDLGELQRRNGELEGLRTELRAARDREGAQAARAASLQEEIRRLERALGSAQAQPRAAPEPVAVGGAEGVPRRESPWNVPPARAERGTTRPRTPLAERVARPEPGPNRDAAAPGAGEDVDGELAGAVRDGRELAQLRGRINELLELSPDTVHYRIDAIGGVQGYTLLDVEAAGVDGAGTAVRRLEAKRVELTVDQETGTLLISFFEGALLLRGRRAPFFDDRYSVAQDCDIERWKRSGLSCVKFK